MKPQKKSHFNLVVTVLALFVAVFVGLQAGNALNEKVALEAANGVVYTGMDAYNIFFERFEARLRDPSFNIAWTEQMLYSLGWSLFIWFIAAAYLLTSKRKYIAGKEFGTAEWGDAVKDLKDLWAAILMKAEIKQAKRVRNFIGRWLAKRKAYKKCRKSNAEIKAAELARLEQWKTERLPQEKKWGREAREQKRAVLTDYAKQKQEIEDRAEKWLEESLREAWKPRKLKCQYKDELAEITYQSQQGLAYSTPEEKRKAKKAAKARYKKSLRYFYSGKDRIEKIKKKYENADTLLTKTAHISIFNYVLNNNILILGGSGSGKTRGFVLPNVLQAHASFVITDPKGEILEKAGYFLETVMGYKIHVLNLDDKSKSDGYNPFVYIHPERPGYEERVLALIEAIIINTDGGEKKGGSDPFWDKAERLFLQAVFFFTCDGFMPDEQNMNTVQALIKMLKIEEEEDNHDSDLDYFVQIFKEQHGADHIGVQQYEEFREKASGKTAKSIVISAVARLAPFKTSEVRRIFSYDTMGLDRLGEEKTAVFVVVPPTDQTFNFIAGMLFTQMFQELQYCATQVHKHDGQRLPVPVRFILDEFATTCTIPNFVKILAYARSFGIGIVPILQSLEQIKNMYKDEWGVIVDNCNTLLYLGSITHMDTLEYMSKLLGKGTFDKKTTGMTRGRTGSSSQNFDVIGRELMDASEVRKLPKKDCLLIVGGKNPFYNEKYDYTSHPNYIYTSDGNAAYSYEYTPPVPPKKQREIAEEHHHREYEKAERVAARVSAIMERVNQEVDEIQMNFNVQNMINRAGQAFVHYAPIRDELLQPDNGEAVDVEMLLGVLDFAKEDERIDDVMLNVQKKVEEANERIDASMEQDGYRMDASPAETAKKAVSIGANLTPIRDELLRPDDGEAENEELDGFVFDSDEDEVPADDELGDLGSLIAGVADIMTETEEPVSA